MVEAAEEVWSDRLGITAKDVADAHAAYARDKAGATRAALRELDAGFPHGALLLTFALRADGLDATVPWLTQLLCSLEDWREFLAAAATADHRVLLVFLRRALVDGGFDRRTRPVALAILRLLGEDALPELDAVAEGWTGDDVSASEARILLNVARGIAEGACAECDAARLSIRRALAEGFTVCLAPEEEGSG